MTEDTKCSATETRSSSRVMFCDRLHGRSRASQNGMSRHMTCPTDAVVAAALIICT
jgi:hypothetical protein